MTHTPLPWTSPPLVYKGSDGNVYNVAIYGDQGRTRVSQENPNQWRDGQETIDNAALIAKAADCHDELVAALEAITDCYGLGLSPEKFCEQVADFMADARAALAKA